MRAGGWLVLLVACGTAPGTPEVAAPGSAHAPLARPCPAPAETSEPPACPDKVCPACPLPPPPEPPPEPPPWHCFDIRLQDGDVAGMCGTTVPVCQELREYIVKKKIGRPTTDCLPQAVAHCLGIVYPESQTYKTFCARRRETCESNRKTMLESPRYKDGKISLCLPLHNIDLHRARMVKQPDSKLAPSDRPVRSSPPAAGKPATPQQ